MKPRPDLDQPLTSSMTDSRFKYVNMVQAKRRNFIMDNKNLITTAVSSPIKGAAIVPMNYYSRP